jgi:hypothetical protein
MTMVNTALFWKVCEVVGKAGMQPDLYEMECLIPAARRRASGNREGVNQPSVNSSPPSVKSIRPGRDRALDSCAVLSTPCLGLARQK